MYNFIKTQYKIHTNGGQSIGIEKIHKIADLYLTAEQRKEIFEGGGYQ